MSINSDLTKTCGNTPLVYIETASKETGANIYGKLEFFNPSSSVKDRAGLAMIEHAFKTGKINSESTIVEPTSGNTGIALAFVARVKKLKLILTMPETMSIERRQLLKHLGADLVLTQGSKGMKGAIEEAKKIVKQTPNSFMPDQFSNPANPEAHRQTTALEIWKDTDGKVDIFVAGVGTGGTITGIAEVIKKRKPEFKAIAVEPKDSPNKIQGIGAGFIPKNLDLNMVDRTEQVTSEDAIEFAQRLSKEEGLLMGISSGAAALAAVRLAEQEEFKGKTIVVILD